MEHDGIHHKTIKVNGINMHIAEKGSSGPIILFVHGFPELWCSWKHQLEALSLKGYRCIAPDLRGYGDSDVPHDASQYTCLHVVGDLVALIDEVAGTGEQEKVFVVGHDWGAIMCWYLCLFRPDKVKALVNLSVAFLHRDPTKKTVETLRGIYGQDYYIVRFQEPGDIEAEFAQIGTERVMKEFFNYRKPGPLFLPEGEAFGNPLDVPMAPPSWMSEEEIEYYTSKFDKTGFTGGLNFYRSLDSNWELTAPWTGAQVKVPVKFIVGDQDLAYNSVGGKDYINSGMFKKDVPSLEEVVVMKGVAHFCMMEKADEISKHIHDFFHKF